MCPHSRRGELEPYSDKNGGPQLLVASWENLMNVTEKEMAECKEHVLCVSSKAWEQAKPWLPLWGPCESGTREGPGMVVHCAVIWILLTRNICYSHILQAGYVAVGPFPYGCFHSVKRPKLFCLFVFW